MNVSEDLVAMVERVRIFQEVTDANAGQVMLEDTVKLVSILAKNPPLYWHSIQKVKNLGNEIDSLNMPKASPKIMYVRYFIREISGKMF